MVCHGEFLIKALLVRGLERIFSFFPSLSAIPRELIQHSDFLLPLPGERAGVRGPRLWKKPLTLTLCRWEREKREAIHIKVILYSSVVLTAVAMVSAVGYTRDSRAGLKGMWTLAVPRR